MKSPDASEPVLLDAADPVEVEAYERAFFAAFERASHNRLVRWLWDWDHASRRLRTRVPYADQRIWVTRDAAGAVMSALAVNVGLSQLQASAYGFELPATLREAASSGRLSEFLTFFAVREGGLARRIALWHHVASELRSMGFAHAVATTAPKVLPMYAWAGATTLAEASLEEETRFFLHFDLRSAGQ